MSEFAPCNHCRQLVPSCLSRRNIITAARRNRLDTAISVVSRLLIGISTCWLFHRARVSARNYENGGVPPRRLPSSRRIHHLTPRVSHAILFCIQIIACTRPLLALLIRGFFPLGALVGSEKKSSRLNEINGFATDADRGN